MRLEEGLEMTQNPKEKEEVYRRFADFHIAQMKHTRLSYQV
jgi:hypothetical protein